MKFVSAECSAMSLNNGSNKKRYLGNAVDRWGY